MLAPSVAYTLVRVLATDLDYDLPDTLIAQFPPADRDGGRMLVVGEQIEHDVVRNLAERIPQGALVVLNDTRVIRARLLGNRAGAGSSQGRGAKVEVLLLNPLDQLNETGDWQALVRCNRALGPGEQVEVGDFRLTIGQALEDGSRVVRSATPLLQLAESLGHVPLPPYMRRPDTPADAERYQTVFSRQLGSAAAPTAGLHFTAPSLARLAARGVQVGFLTLHVGAGTFRPVSAPTLAEHPMHSERFCVSPALVAQINATKAAGKPVVAVGTTVVRALESAFGPAPDVEQLDTGNRPPRLGWQSTRLLIQPGYQFEVVDALLTNFHAPRSTLLALVFAFAGLERVKAAYAEAINQSYRFLSYGDAMWIPNRLS